MARRRRLAWGGAAAALAALIGLAQILTSGNRSHTLTPNATDGTVDSAYPNGDKPPGGVTLSWNLVGFPTVTGLTTGTPVNHNARQYLSGTGAAAATLAVVHVSGDNAATEGWSISTDSLVHPGDNTGSGVFKLRATNGAVTADSANISWAYTAPVTADWDWADTDGLGNGAVSGGGNWVAFNGATLNADPDTDNYIQLTAAADGQWGGMSTHHAQPAFIAGNTYSVTITIGAGGSYDRIWCQLGLGTAVEFVGPGAITHDVVAGVGTANAVFHWNGDAGAVEGATTQITAISATAVTNIFNFASATYSVNETAGTLEIGVTRSQPTAATASITVSRTAGTDAVLTVTDTTLNWSASEGGTKFSTLAINGDGQATIGISSPSVGAVGAVSSTVVTVAAAASGSDFPRLGMLWIGSGDLGSHTTMYQSAQGIENMRRRHLVIMARWPELQAVTGVTMESIVSAVKAASTIGTRVCNYSDQDGVYKSSYTAAYATKQAKMAAEQWYAYASGTTGPVDSYFGSNLITVNNTVFAPADSNGMRAMEWMTKNEWGWMALGQDGNTASPSLDCLYIDNIINSPRVNADWNRDGSIDSYGNAFAPPWNVTPKTWYRAGIAAGITAFRATYPTVPVIGNIEFMNVSSATDLPEYDGLMDGGTLEGVMGHPDSAYESFFSTAQLVSRVQLAEDMIRDPLYGMVTCYASNGQQTNYKEMRHCLTFTLVATNMTFGWEREAGWGNWDWYEEYDFNLGQRIGTRETSATQNGIWRGDFDNGIALWCPRGVTGTITLGATFYALQGNASANLSDGQAVTSWTCSVERDGIILSRTPTALAWEWVSPLDRNAANDDVYEYREAA